MRELEEVDITFPRVMDGDGVIETLVQNSPSVKSFTMNNARMTDAGLRSLSRLTGLQLLVLKGYWSRCNITTEGILSLLRGSSRHVLRDLRIESDNIA